MLPNMVHADGLVKQTQEVFAGLDHNAAVRDGYLYDMRNLSGALYPVLSPRKGRTAVRGLTKPNGLFAREKLCFVDGTDFYYDGAVKGQVTDGEKRFARLGAYVLIFPDKVYYNTTTDEFGALEVNWTGAAEITHYVYDAEGDAETVYAGNAITTTGAAFPFEAGDAVEITGSAVDTNNRTPVIREIVNGGKTLVFTNNTFTEHGSETLTISRKVPDMDFFCENENRLWGCKGNEIFASALGNPFRWYNYEGLATDAYAVTVGSDGAFTGAAAFLGYAMFFKEDAIHKMYGAKPSNFQAMASAVSGVMAGCAGSMAVAGETLFYLSRTGVVSYQGGVPNVISAALGTEGFAEAAGGSDGTRYYLSARQGDVWTLYCYDTRNGLWHKEDGIHAKWFARADGVLYYLDAADGTVYSVGTGTCESVSWMAETGDFTDGGPDKEGVLRLQLRLEADAGTTVTVSVQFDSDGVWREVRTVTAARKRSVILPIVPRRCDHWRVRIEGTGGCRLFGLTREYYKGSML